MMNSLSPEKKTLVIDFAKEIKKRYPNVNIGCNFNNEDVIEVVHDNPEDKYGTGGFSKEIGILFYEMLLEKGVEGVCCYYSSYALESSEFQIIHDDRAIQYRTYQTKQFSDYEEFSDLLGQSLAFSCLEQPTGTIFGKPSGTEFPNKTHFSDYYSFSISERPFLKFSQTQTRISNQSSCYNDQNETELVA